VGLGEASSEAGEDSSVGLGEDSSVGAEEDSSMSGEERAQQDEELSNMCLSWFLHHRSSLA
jgi:hypothetical protein